MNRAQAHAALLKASLVVGAVLFAIFCVSILDSRPNNTTSSVELVSDVVKRVPAAIPGLMKEARKPRTGDFEVVKLPCIGSPKLYQNLETQSTWIRLASENCEKDDKILEAHIENKTNGYVATVFTMATDKMTSEFIPLLEGDNQFELNVKMDSGSTFTQHWRVDRRPTASN